MKLPRVRFTVRRMMVAVVIASLLFGIVAGLLRRRAAFQLLAEKYDRKASREYFDGQIIVPPSSKFEPATPAEIRRQEIHYKLGEYYLGLMSKYKRAANRPWLPVAPDPPEAEPE